MVKRAILPGVLIAAALWFLLYVILAVPLWVSFVAAGGALVLYAAVGGALTRLRGRDDRTLAPHAREDDRRLTSQVYELLRAPLRVTGLVVSGGLFVILYAVIGVPLWVSILAAGAVYAVESLVEHRGARRATVGVRHPGEPRLKPHDPDLESARRGDGSAERHEAPLRPRDSVRTPVAH